VEGNFEGPQGEQIIKRFKRDLPEYFTTTSIYQPLVSMADEESSLKKPLDVEKATTNRPAVSVPFSGDEDGSGEGGLVKGCMSYFDLGFTSLAGKVGTYTGFFTLVATMFMSVIVQKVAPEDETLRKKWLSGCESGFEESCLANQGILRFSCALVVLYGLNLLMTAAAARLYDQFWWVKLPFYVGICWLFFYLDASRFDNHGFAWFARIGGFLYIMLQQVILLDFALSWNERWIDNSNAERGLISGYNRMDRWQLAILLCGFGLLIFAIVSLSVMLKIFGGCSSSDWILSLGIVITIVGLVVQLKCTKIGSVLTSGVMGAYYAYICYSAVTLNPDQTCNPTISKAPQTWRAVVGMAWAILSLSYTCWKTIQSLPGQALKGVTADDVNVYATEGLRTIFVIVSVIFILGSCYYAMVLTNWSTLQANYNMGNAQIGKEAMWLQGSAALLCFLMYIWAIMAPMIWPERFGYDPKRLHGRR
jgi:hypothetical protein